MFEAKLQMRLESSEPKCANCANWEQSKALPMAGVCSLMYHAAHGILDMEIITAQSVTTDLTVCSRWTRKEDTHGQQAQEADAASR